MKNRRVFLSYAREDTDTAEKVYRDLTKAGLDVWFDKHSLLPGQKWKLEILKAIKESAYFVALLSSQSVSKKGYVQKEVKEALEVLDEYPESDIFIIPVRIDDCNPTNPKLKELQWVDLFPSFEEGIKKIFRSIKPEFFAKRIDARENLELKKFLSQIGYYPEFVSLKELMDSGITDEPSIKSLRARSLGDFLFFVERRGSIHVFDKQLSAITVNAARLCKIPEVPWHHISIALRQANVTKEFLKKKLNLGLTNKEVIEIVRQAIAERVFD